jgi:DNA repair exonuclease SbcCD ATPase subunit
MIERLQVTNWRAYDRLDIELGPGATFVVASNGIGKTSFIMAAAWGVFGDMPGVRGADEIRGDAEHANVTVDLRLPSGDVLAISRSVDQRGRIEIEATVGDRTITSQDDLERLLTEAFGADSYVLAQLTFMIHGGLHETQSEFELRDHLAGIFGVRPLFEAAERADAVASEAAAALRKTKVIERKDKRDKQELVDDLATGERELDEAQQQHDRAVATRDQAADVLRAAEDWTNYRRALSERDAKLAAYAEVAASLLDRTVDPANVIDTLTEWEANETRALSEIEARAATARGRAAATRESVETLSSADATCPTCLRPFGEHDAEEAAAEHHRQLASLDETIREADEEAAAQRGVLENLRRILADIRSVPVPLEPSTEDRSSEIDALRQAADAARDEVTRHVQSVANLAAMLTTTREALAELEQSSDLLVQQEQLFRLEAIARAGAESFRETADRIMEQYIEPLVEEVARRWKQAFGRGGLQLSADGRITRKVGSRTLGFGALSGGERVWALLVARLLVAGASTRAPFIWLDEPLEHLDPRLRRIVAGTLAMASSRAGIRQVIVTTYEAPIAQQLMEDVPSASLIYVSTAD